MSRRPGLCLLPGNRQMLAEHRGYLPLATEIAVTVLGIDRVLTVSHDFQRKTTNVADNLLQPRRVLIHVDVAGGRGKRRHTEAASSRNG